MDLSKASNQIPPPFKEKRKWHTEGPVTAAEFRDLMERVITRLDGK